MVRAQGKQTPEERKDSKKKVAAAPGGSSKKKSDTGTWPCKMGGCKKVFAREADLKRHQRTTKTHSIPGFQCPQCDATFTRTDALRRHQKSRHNGVVIEPAEQDKSKQSGDGDDRSSGSRSPSPGGSPSRSQGEGSANSSPAQSSRAESSGRGGSYYRPHTQDGYYSYGPPRPPGMMIDPHYPPQPIGIPTSATRGNWAPSSAPHWSAPEGMPPPPPGMFVPSTYYPSPYYRVGGMPPPPQIAPELLAQSSGQNGVGPLESALRNTGGEISSVRHEESSVRDAGARASDRSSSTGRASVSATPSSGTGQKEPPAQEPDESTLMAAAALQAVLAFQKEQELRQAGASVSARAADPAGPSTIADASAPVKPKPGSGAGAEAAGATGAGATVPALAAEADKAVPAADVVRAEPPENLDPQLLNEGGVRILNPAELLTQVEHLLSVQNAPSVSEALTDQPHK